MSDTVPPALTPEQWEDVETRGGVTLFSIVSDIIGWPDDAAAAMAVANHALREGDPHKITSEDIRELLCAARVIEGEGWDGYSVREVAAKLAALLPPEA